MVSKEAQSDTHTVTEAGLYRRMRLIRGFEERVQSLFLRGEVYGTTHLYSGQEAVAVGFASALRDGDRVACTYRGHGHTARDAAPIRRLCWRSCSAARRGQRRPGRLDEHRRPGPRPDRLLRDRRRQHRHRHGRSAGFTGSGAIAVAYFGDGATNQAYFFECLNFAKVLNLPVVFVCENNGYGEYTPTEAVTAGSIVASAGRWDCRRTEVDGMDVSAVREFGARRDRACPRAVADPNSSRRGPTGSSATRVATRASTGPRASSSAGRSAIRSSVAERTTADRHDRRRGACRPSSDGVDAELERVERAALAAPFPEPRWTHPEFKEGRASG